jgi:hypothetical protein
MDWEKEEEKNTTGEEKGVSYSRCKFTPVWVSIDHRY